MSMLGVEVKGFRELDSAFKKLPGEVSRKALKPALKAGAEVIEERAARNAPVRTGKLRDSMMTILRTRAGELVASIGPSREAWYGHLVEFGTSRTAGRPFLRPAVDEGKGEIVGAVRVKLWDGIKKAARKLRGRT